MNNTNLVVLSELLAPAAINLNLRSLDRDAVLWELVQLVPGLKNQPEGQAVLLKALQEREALHSTGIGDGVALPHARNALVGLLDHATIAFGRSSAGISFGSIDWAPTHLFFLLIAPTVTQHLAILARISRLLRDPKLRARLLTVSKAEEVLESLREAEKRS